MSKAVVIPTVTILVIGLAWITSSASGDTTDTTVATDSTGVGGDGASNYTTTDAPTPAPTTEELAARVAELEKTIADLSTALASAESTIASMNEAVDVALAKVERVAAKTSQLAEDGTYTGTVTPSQISPRLTANDVRGDWPLSRTDGSLSTDRLVADGWGCNNDSRYNTALVVSAFRGLECARLPK